MVRQHGNLPELGGQSDGLDSLGYEYHALGSGNLEMQGLHRTNANLKAQKSKLQLKSEKFIVLHCGFEF